MRCSFDEGIVGEAGDILERLQVARIGELIQADDVVCGYLLARSRTTCEPMKPVPPVMSRERR